MAPPRKQQTVEGQQLLLNETCVKCAKKVGKLAGTFVKFETQVDKLTETFVKFAAKADKQNCERKTSEAAK